jgi:hypothetical protein
MKYSDTKKFIFINIHEGEKVEKAIGFYKTNENSPYFGQPHILDEFLMYTT